MPNGMGLNPMAFIQNALGISVSRFGGRQRVLENPNLKLARKPRQCSTVTVKLIYKSDQQRLGKRLPPAAGHDEDVNRSPAFEVDSLNVAYAIQDRALVHSNSHGNPPAKVSNGDSKQSRGFRIRNQIVRGKVPKRHKAALITLHPVRHFPSRGT